MCTLVLIRVYPGITDLVGCASNTYHILAPTTLYIHVLIKEDRLGFLLAADIGSHILLIQSHPPFIFLSDCCCYKFQKLRLYPRNSRELINLTCELGVFGFIVCTICTGAFNFIKYCLIKFNALCTAGIRRVPL